MLTVYIVCAIVCGVLLLISAFTGVLDGDADIDLDSDADIDLSVDDVDLDADVDADHDFGEALSDSSAWLFLSLRFWTTAIGAFGVLGLIFTWRQMLTEPFRALVAAGPALLAGATIAVIYRYLKSGQGESNLSQRDFIGAEAKVLVPVRGSDFGKIRAEVKGNTIDLLATSDSEMPHLEGESVLIVGMEGDRAQVARAVDILGS